MSTGVRKTLKGEGIGAITRRRRRCRRAIQTDLCGFVSRALRAHSEPDGRAHRIPHGTMQAEPASPTSTKSTLSSEKPSCKTRVEIIYHIYWT